MERETVFLPNRDPNPASRKLGETQFTDPAGTVKLTVSVCSLHCPVPSSAWGSHGLQRGRDLGAESRFSATATHPGLLPPCLAPPTAATHPPSPTVSPARLSPCLGAWLGCQAHAGALILPQCSLSCSSTPGSPQHCSPGSAPSLPPAATRVQGVPIRAGSHTAFTRIQLEPSPSHLPCTPCPPHPPQSPQAAQHPGTFPLAPALGLSEHWSQAPGAHGEAGNRQQLPWWQATVSPWTLQTLGEDTFIALPQPVTHKFFGAGEPGTRGAGTVVPGV